MGIVLCDVPAYVIASWPAMTCTLAALLLTLGKLVPRRNGWTCTAKLNLWVEARRADDMHLYVSLSKLERNGNEV